MRVVAKGEKKRSQAKDTRGELMDVKREKKGVLSMPNAEREMNHNTWYQKD